MQRMAAVTEEVSSFFEFPLAPHLVLLNDFVVRREALEAVAVPLAFADPEPRILWRNPRWSQAVAGPEERRVTEVLARTDPAVPVQVALAGFRVQSQPLRDLTGAVRGFLLAVESEGGALPLEVIDQLGTGIAVASEARFQFSNRAADRFWGRALTGTAWASLPELPSWQEAAAIPGGGFALYSLSRGKSLWVRRVGAQVVIEVTPQEIRGEVMAMDQLGSMIHAVKNRLAVASGFIELAQRQQGEGQPEAAGRYLASSRAALDRLDQLLDGLHHLMRPPEPKPAFFSLAELSQEVFAAACREHGVSDGQLAMEGDLTVYADPRLIGEVLRRLFDNALEAYAEQGRAAPWIGIGGQSGGGRVLVRVSDRAGGMPEEVRLRLFSGFVSEKPYGAGLGLLVARRLVEAHHGRLVVEGDREGTRVRLELPQPRWD